MAQVTVPAPPPRERPIAVFDSGVGGLTVLQELLVELPHEDFIYLGDTARFPYGERSAGELERFSLEISERKAYTSALVGVRTADLLGLVQPGQALYALPTVGGGRVCPMGGGVPLFDDGGKVFAGIGVSGGTVDQDTAIVEAALG